MTVTISIVAACCLALPLAVLGIECWCSLLPLRRHKAAATTAPLALAVIIPAHNEEDRIAATVSSIKAQIADSSTIVVIADNCVDATAQRAAAAGAIVWERIDPAHRGKGYALNFAVDRLANLPPDVVVVVDADCIPGPNCLQTLVRVAHHYQRPIQAAYRMHAPETDADLSSTSALAVLVKNVVRPRGLQRLGLPCMLSGSGMAFPWKALSAVRFPDHHITEDMRMTGDLANAGLAPIPCMEANISSALPAHRAGFMSQRTRWEHGHLATILRVAPQLLLGFVKRPRLQIAATLLELSVPPLSLLLFNTAICTVVLAVLCYLIAYWAPLVCYLALAAFAAAGIIAVWLRFGRKILSPRNLLQIPRYVLAKAPMYLRFVTRRQRAWIRTERPAPAAGDQLAPGPLRAHSANFTPTSDDQT